ncbi:MAG: hypothetical protein QOC92_3204 [Acidimicrobiaceae bacterium]|jgi:hypothetical protein
MAKAKVRCTGCGAMNSDELSDRCRVCHAILPDAARRRAANLDAKTDGPAFSDLVESEVSAWQEYAEGRNRPGAKTRRPAEDAAPAPPRRSWFRSKQA